MKTKLEITQDRMASELALRALALGYTQDSCTTSTPVLDLIEKEEGKCESADNGFILKRLMQFFFAEGAHPASVLRRFLAVAKAVTPSSLAEETDRDVEVMISDTREGHMLRLEKAFTGYANYLALRRNAASQLAKKQMAKVEN